MILPLLILLAAIISAGDVAYGAYPYWMRFPHGLEMILWSRRLQWLLVALSLLACVGLIGLVISGKRRAWWLIGLAPVLALFAHRFTIGPAARAMAVVENPPLLSAAEAKLADDDWVVGLVFRQTPYAYPYAALFSAPAVLQADRDDHWMLMWSAYANRAVAVLVKPDVHARDLDVVSLPANALLLYDSRHGQFINGLTAQTPQQQPPNAFTAELPLPTSKMQWKQWRALHPDTHVFAHAAPAGVGPPTAPLEPLYPMPDVPLDRPANTRIALVGAASPLAFEPALLTPAPLNGKADKTPIVLFRDPEDGSLRAFDRRLFDPNHRLDLIVQFAPNLHRRKHPKAAFIDLGSNSGWNFDAQCVDSPPDVKFQGKRLTPVGIDDDLPLGVMKFWYPSLTLEIPPAAPIAVEPEQDPDASATRPAKHKTRRRANP